jgi:hypothetical protein
MTFVFKRAALAFLATVACAAPAAAAPTFILNDTGGVGLGTQARSGFEAAAALWAARFTDNVTIRLDVGFKQLGTGILGSTGSSRSDVAYSSVRSALTNDRSSATDNTAVASLGNTLSFLSNEAGNCSTGAGCRAISATSRTIDNDNTRDNNWLSVNTANQKALGLRGDNGSADGSITFSNQFSWDFDRSNGITSGAFDFVGVAAHEIGHALGFVSGVDLVDSNIGARGLDGIAWGTVLDLFRYQNGIRDWTVGGAPCISVDSGRTCVGALSTGVKNGDGRQASHWKDNLGLGIMDPTAAPGELVKITTNDLTAFDAIGWNLAQGAAGLVQWGTNTAFTSGYIAHENVGPALVPSPAAAGLIALGLGFLATRRRRAV